MNPIVITASTGRSDCTAVIVGHCAARLPRLVETIAAKLAKGDLSGAQRLHTPEGTYLLLKPEDKAWLVGGEQWRVLGGELVAQARALGAGSVTVLVEGSGADAQRLTEGALLGDYRYSAHRSGKEGARKPITVRLPGHAAAIAAGVRVADCQNLARELADMPANLLNPQTFVARAKKELRGLGLRLKVVSGAAALTRAGFPGLVQVGKAGSAAPALLEIHYAPKKVRGSHRLALVGKGVTFDSGGISIKAGAGMWEMKGDMGGAAAVLAAMKLIAQEQATVPVAGYCALAENMPDSTAVRPGDIYKTRSGKWVHIDNTDAEGRLVIGDVLTYACEQGATHLVDVATLTGACLVALGDHIAGLMGRDDTWLKEVRAAGQEVGEEFWPLPLYGEYRTLLDHPHADINNVGGRNGGTITAGLFLSEMVDPKVKWAHCDIAGPAIQTSGWRYYAKGMTGFATRTLAHLAHKL